jgi:hypothetical protein
MAAVFVARGGLRLLTILALLTCLTAVPAQREEEAPEPERAEEVWRRLADEMSPHVARLMSYARANKLHHEAHSLAEVLLQFSPDHEEARKLLKYRRKRGGEWERGFYRKPNKKSSKLSPEFELRWQTAKQGFVDRAVALLEREEAPPDAMLRRQIVHTLVAMSPESERIRKLGGEVKFDGRWLLQESVTALRRRKELRDEVREALEKAPAPRAYEISALTKKLGAPWKVALRTDKVRVVTVTDEGEARRMAQVCHVAGIFARNQLRVAWRFPSSYEIHSLKTKGQYLGVLQNIPDMEPKDRAFAEKMSSTWIDNVRFVGYHEEFANRLDSATRQTVNMVLSDGFDIDREEGWAMEGFASISRVSSAARA